MIDFDTEEMTDVRRFAGNLLTLLMQQEGIWTFEIRPEGLAVHWTMVTPIEDIPAMTSIRSCRYMLPFIEIRLGRSVEAAAAAILQMAEQSEAEPEDTTYCQICEDCTCEWEEYDDDDWVEEDFELDEEDDDEDGD